MIYARKNKLLKESEQNLTGEDIREGLTAIISVKIEDPQFEGQTKQKLGNSEARGAVDNVVSSQLEIYLEQNPSVAKIIVEKSILSQRARDAARKARELTEENPPWRVCLCPENWQTAWTKTRANAKSIL